MQEVFLLPHNTDNFYHKLIRIMKTKLTLTIEDKVIDSAKKYAQIQGKSLSQLVENYLKSITSEQKGKNVSNISPRILNLMGVINLSQDFDYKTQLGNALAKKYSK